MSAGAQGDGTRSVARLRRMLANNLLERAVASSEMRWPGSGPMVRLVHEWGDLPPTARRQRMAEIGPEELAKFRFLGEMNPELGKVLDDLETRGIIPPAVTEPPPPLREDDDVESAAAGSTPPVSFDEAVIDAAVDYAAAGAAGAAATAGALTARDRMAALQAEASVRSAARSRDAADSAATRLAAGAAAAAAAAAVSAAMPTLQGGGVAGDAAVAEALKQRPAAHINLHKENQERMQVALEQATSILDRVRSTVDRQARLPMTASWPTTDRPQTEPTAPMLATQPAPFLPTVERAQAPRQTFTLTEPTRARDAQGASVLTASDFDLDPEVIARQQATTRGAQEWTEQLREAGAFVVTVDDRAQAPTMAMMLQVGQALHLPVVELDSALQTRHEMWGGLRREGRTTAAFAGALPLALAQGSLVVLRGSLPRAHQARIAEGYIDIPGTRASMRVHPDSRLLLLG